MPSNAKVRAVSSISDCDRLVAWMSWNFSQASETLEMNSLTKTSLAVNRGLATMSQSQPEHEICRLDEADPAHMMRHNEEGLVRQMCDAGAVGAAFIVSPAFVPCRLERASMYLPHVEAASDTCCAISRTLASIRHPRPCRTCRGNSQAWGRDGRCATREGVSPLRPLARRCGTPLTQTAGPQCLCRAHTTCRHQSPCSVRRYNRSLVHMAKSKRSMLG